MKGVLKGTCPAPLATWLALANPEWTPTYGAFSGQPKTETHDALLVEQKGVCVYCGRALSPDRSDSHIDHFRPQEKFNSAYPPDLTLAYQNLVVSCGRNRLPARHPDRRPVICGEAKDNWFDATLHVDPTDVNCETRFAYGTSGLISPKSTPDAAAAKMIEILNLNEESLKYERSVLILGIEFDILAGKITSISKLDELDQYRKTPEGGYLPTFAHVAARYIEDEV